ncbi:MAG: lecithin retinol acyltransferase family protein [Hyphomonadaceae bacterium]|nr:lecithin retinol acyltransferase family protein [Hyphomonadaceae bacterium]
MTSRFDRFEAGDVVAIPFGIGLSHYGLVTSRGTVISNSSKHGGVVEQSLAEFSNGRRIRLCESTDALDAVVAESRARRAKGASYSLTEANCAHFTRWSRRQRPTKVQIAAATVSAFADMLFGPKRRY